MLPTLNVELLPGLVILTVSDVGVGVGVGMGVVVGVGVGVAVAEGVGIGNGVGVGVDIEPPRAADNTSMFAPGSVPSEAVPRYGLLGASR